MLPEKKWSRAANMPPTNDPMAEVQPSFPEGSIQHELNELANALEYFNRQIAHAEDTLGPVLLPEFPSPKGEDRVQTCAAITRSSIAERIHAHRNTVQVLMERLESITKRVHI